MTPTDKVLRENLEGFLFTMVIVHNVIDNATELSDWAIAAECSKVNRLLHEILIGNGITDDEIDTAYDKLRTEHTEKYGETQ